MPTWFLAPIAGLKLPTQIRIRINGEVRTCCFCGGVPPWDSKQDDGDDGGEDEEEGGEAAVHPGEEQEAAHSTRPDQDEQEKSHAHT
jgi:hypothetical protein